MASSSSGPRVPSSAGRSTGRDSSAGSSPASSSGSSPGSSGSSSGGSGVAGLRETVCAFWLGSRCYGISTSLVGEVFTVEDVAVVPLAPPAVLGVFNLRGAPVALIDTARVLELPGASAGVTPGTNATALVIRRGTTILAGLLIDRMESVIGLEQGVFTPRDWAAEHAAVGGFLELEARRLVITLFDTAAVVERLNALKYR